MQKQLPSRIEKILTRNDTGETGSHQAGMAVPKRQEILSFFPELDKDVHNPRVLLDFWDEDGNCWQLAFIYYNNKFFGGTRNEYRLSKITRYIKKNNLVAGDVLILIRDQNDMRHISHSKNSDTKSTDRCHNSDPVIQIDLNWKVFRK